MIVKLIYKNLYINVLGELPDVYFQLITITIMKSMKEALKGNSFIANIGLIIVWAFLAIALIFLIVGVAYVLSFGLLDVSEVYTVKTARTIYFVSLSIGFVLVCQAEINKTPKIDPLAAYKEVLTGLKEESAKERLREKAIKDSNKFKSRFTNNQMMLLFIPLIMLSVFLMSKKNHFGLVLAIFSFVMLLGTMIYNAIIDHKNGY